MNKFIKKLNKISIKLLYNMYNIKIEKINILYTKNYNYGDISIIISSIFCLKDKEKKKFGIYLGNYIIKKFKKYIYKYNFKNNFLNFFLTNYFYIEIINKFLKLNFNINKFINDVNNNNKLIIIDYSSPNTNKPLHIGHLRNMLIGNTISNIYYELGYKVIKSQIINDRGIHICKSIVSWKLFFNGITPLSYNIKSDHFVGKLYFKFEKELNKEIKNISYKYNINNEKAKKLSKLLIIVNDELVKWENNNTNSIYIWKMINLWAYKGFKKTYNALNIKFDEIIYESKTYIIGKKIINKGIKNKIFFLDKDKSVYFLFKKKKIILLRSNGTSLYITQEIGTLIYRLKKYKKIHLLIYVVGNEQIYHFNILFEIVKKINLSIKNNNLFHLSYNSVNFLGKKIKSRYGKNIIFIDDLIDKMYINVIKKFKEKKKKYNNKKKILKLISIGAIKYQFIKINPNKIIDFNFDKCLELKGNTGIYIQYTYVRIYSILKKNKNKYFIIKKKHINLIKKNEKDILKNIIEYPNIINKSAYKYDPSIFTNYVYDLSKKINVFYQNNKIINIKNIYKKNIRLIICNIILKFLDKSMKILGIPIIKKI
ncbi:MAG: arginine--tRNA ligase [Candidatus Shikimatogenerans bostrichidophilus]|nr:MAG: arginine--tRNA ligase [Candidatus Shikimatogenerans bostrichidophilus]